MSFFTSPTSFRLNNPDAAATIHMAAADASPLGFSPFKKRPHESHPPLGSLVLLVFEAVMEVVGVSLPGYILARLGHFDVDKQKFIANLNVMLFTPCLIFIKLAGQLTASKLADLAIIPVLFVIMTLVSWIVSRVVAKAFRLNKRATNFVTAMGVFGNSNSLPISLVLSLSQTIKGLHWDKVPGDNDDEVAARGILYLLIFQQLGQLIRWSWGYHVLLAPKDKYEEYRTESVEEGRYRDGDDEDDRTQVPGQIDGITEAYSDDDDDDTDVTHDHTGLDTPSSSDGDGFVPAGRTPIAGTSSASLADMADGAADEDLHNRRKYHSVRRQHGKPVNGKGTPKKKLDDGLNRGHPQYVPQAPDGEGTDILTFPRIPNESEADAAPGVRGLPLRIRVSMARFSLAARKRSSETANRVYAALPTPLQFLVRLVGRVATTMWDSMNPPLWAMLAAVVVASIPDLQRLFFREGSFVKNSITSAIASNGGVAVPLILVVLGANLARNTENGAGDDGGAYEDAEEKQIGTRLLVASLVARMVLPTLLMLPILAVAAKYVPVSILDDPIFVIVCFLLSGAPSAIQLAQICQINGVYESVMPRVLFQGYVIWLLPSTLFLVMCALEVVEWAKPIPA